MKKNKKMKYEELPEWIQRHLFNTHEHLVNKTYPQNDAWVYNKRQWMISENYDNWFDENQKLYYSEDSVLKLIEILLKNNYENEI